MRRFDAPQRHKAGTRMPATNPRLYVTVSRDCYREISRLAAIQERPKAAIARDLLEASAPTLARLTGVLEYAAKASESYKRDLVLALEDAEGKLQHFALEAFESAEARARGWAIADRERARAPKPPPSNRGVATPRGKR